MLSPTNDSYRGFENVVNYGFSNIYEHDRPRALIDAYGHDDGQRPLNEKPLGMNGLNVNGVFSKIPETSWQNTEEEEEFNWEDMNPTLADGKTRNATLPPRVVGAMPDISSLSSRHVDPIFRRNGAASNQISGLGDSLKAVEDV